MDKVTLDEYINEHPFAQDTILKVVNDKILNKDVNISVYYEDIMFDGKRSKFMLFVDNVLAVPVLDFPCGIELEDVIKIAKDMIKEYLDKVESSFVNIGCIFYDENEMKSCDFNIINDIDKYYLDDYEFTLVEKIWSDKYGVKSLKHKEHVHENMINSLSEYLSVVGKDREYIEDLMEYIKFHLNV